MKKMFKRAASANLLRISALALLGTTPLSAMACGSEPYLGEICTFAFNFCPNGFLPADGRQLPISNYQALYSLLGISFGGNGTTNFNLPDLRGRVAVGTGTSDYGTTTQLGQKGGNQNFTLAANNLPAHTHPASAAVAAGSLMSGQLSLPVTGGTVSGQTINGSVTVNALNGATTGAQSTPSSTANTVGKVGGLSAFYPAGTNLVAVPSSHNLTVSGGTISGASATANVTIPAANTNVPVTVNPNNATQATVVPTMTPYQGLTVCISATNGIYPPRP